MLGNSTGIHTYADTVAGANANRKKSPENSRCSIDQTLG